MSLRFEKLKAVETIRAEAHRTKTIPLDSGWVEKIERLSQLCSKTASKTHIAFLGTAILAKSLDRSVDLYAIKPKHSPDSKHAFSARSLCHEVLVPVAAELGIDIGVSGREPLNNQPYFRMKRLDDGTPVSAGGRAAFDYMLSLVEQIKQLPDEASARLALRAFIAVRQKYQRSYLAHVEGEAISAEDLLRAIKAFVKDNSEGGKRAQAVAAGLLDVFAGVTRVESGRINDPSRRYPGDVCVRSALIPSRWEKAFEVRDKPVSYSDIQIFGKKCLDMGVVEAAVVMVADAQQQIDREELLKWAADFGLGLTLFMGWESLMEQVLFWAEPPESVGVNSAVSFIHQRLIAVEATVESVNLWATLTRATRD